jgi:hypothetical protein
METNDNIIAEHIRAAYMAGDLHRMMYIAHTLRASGTEDSLKFPVQSLDFLYGKVDA